MSKLDGNDDSFDFFTNLLKTDFVRSRPRSNSAPIPQRPAGCKTVPKRSLGYKEFHETYCGMYGSVNNYQVAFRIGQNRRLGSRFSEFIQDWRHNECRTEHVQVLTNQTVLYAHFLGAESYLNCCTKLSSNRFPIAPGMGSYGARYAPYNTYHLAGYLHPWATHERYESFHPFDPKTSIPHVQRDLSRDEALQRLMLVASDEVKNALPEAITQVSKQWAQSALIRFGAQLITPSHPVVVLITSGIHLSITGYQAYQMYERFDNLQKKLKELPAELQSAIDRFLQTVQGDRVSASEIRRVEADVRIVTRRVVSAAVSMAVYRSPVVKKAAAPKAAGGSSGGGKKSGAKKPSRADGGKAEKVGNSDSKLRNRKQALNEAKDRAGIPRSQQPKRQWEVGDDPKRRGMKNYKYDENPGGHGRYYEYRDAHGNKKVVAEHTKDPNRATKHVHAGEAKLDGDPKTYDFKEKRYKNIKTKGDQHIDYE